ncbi:MAG: TetR/AcrR family transcriptional regulator [Desulfobacterales bacterium]
MGDMKQKIKQVAINLFYKKGYYATSMSHIAQGSKIQKASIYHHYPNKEEILVDIFRTTIEDLEKSLESHLKVVRGAENRMRAAIHSHITFHIERQKEAIIADSELRVLTVNNYKTFIRMRDNYERKFQKVIKEGIDEGIFKQLDYKIVSYGILTMCTAVCSWFNNAGRLTKDEVAKILADFIIRGLKGESKPV